jgi:molecular chaperone GrpE (heat shock protein)
MSDPVKEPPLADLDLRHWSWVIDWALERCTENIKQNELEIIRHQNSASEERVKVHGGSEPRAKVLERLNQYGSDYHRIHRYLSKVKTDIMTANSEQFAKDIMPIVRQAAGPASKSTKRR